MTLRTQSLVWSAGYVLLIALVVGCAWHLPRGEGKAAARPTIAASDHNAAVKLSFTPAGNGLPPAVGTSKAHWSVTRSSGGVWVCVGVGMAVQVGTFPSALLDHLAPVGLVRLPPENVAWQRSTWEVLGVTR